MRLGRRLLPLVGLIGLLGATPVAIGAGGAVSRGTAVKAPRTAAAKIFGSRAAAESISCPSAGSCVAGGFGFADGQPAFVAEASNGVWREVNTEPGAGAMVLSVSCSSAGDCVAGGSHYDGSRQAFVMEESNGVWGTGITVPGIAALNVGGDAVVTSVSCSSSGNCTAGGWYNDGTGVDDGSGEQAFVVDEKNGVWGAAIEVPGSAALNVSGGATVVSVSCATAGTCAAVGWYADGSKHQQAFVVNETGGVWGTAEKVDTGRSAVLWSVSCAGPGACAAGGSYSRSGHRRGFVIDERHGVWGDATKLPGGGEANVLSISCTRAGTCAAGGYYTDSKGREQAFVVNERRGVWGTLKAVPGTRALNTGHDAQVTSVSCSGPRNCAAGGYYTDRSAKPSKAFVARERNGVWRTARKVRHGASTGPGGSARVTSVSCARRGPCKAVGWYTDSVGYWSFVTSP